jgi:AcrR family transcriptional regulator
MENLKEITISAKAKATRKRILEAAAQVFSSKGYHETRVDDIVETSNSSKGSVYSYFPGKQQIFLALVDQFADLIQKRLGEAIDQESDGVRRVDAALRICLETFAKYRGLAKILLIQAVGLGSVFEEKRLEIHDRFATMIQNHLNQAVVEGDIPLIDTEVVAYAWMGAINEVIIRWVHTGQPEPERVVHTLRTMLLRGIGVCEARIRQLDNQEER